MVPDSYPDELILSADEKYLYGAFYFRQAVFAYDVQAIKNQLKDVPLDVSTEWALDDLKGKDTHLTFNGDIDVKADYVPIGFDPVTGGLEVGPHHGDASNDPIGTNTYVRKLATQQSFLKLIDPAGGEELTTAVPEFSWNLGGRTGYRSSPSPR